MKKLISMILSLSLITIVIPASAEDVATSAKASILIEQETGRVLQEKEADTRLPIASVTKIMTMLLIMEEIDGGRLTLADKVTVSEYAMSMGGSTMFLEAGEVLTVSDMLKGIAVASANDGCVAMAEYISGSTDAFISLMNKRAKELGMNNTNFMNTNGLDADGHYSSARDVAIMARELCKHEKIFDYTTIWTDSLRDGKFELANTNKLVRFYRGATGLKTGSTDLAGCCLCASATRDGLSLISVVLGAPTSKERFADASGLLDYGFANYRVVRPVSKGEALGSVKVRKGISDVVSAVTASDFSEVVNKNDMSEIETNVTLAENITAPVAVGEVIGRAEFIMGGKSIGSVDLIAECDVEKKSFLAILSDILRSIVGA
ncbi:MAG: D-alanyl-D-alanine carboxypeptidase family protein [Clostridia bacterium]|nr:D-alanyl-D-alanine carboxypeptidase family protein [Clostridia bacterium]